MSKQTKVNSFLKNVDEDLLKTLIKFSKPSNKFGDIYLKDITEWKFCDVTEFSESINDDIILKMIDSYGYRLKDGKQEPVNITAKDIEKGGAKEFVSLLAHIRKEFEKVELLMKQLNSEPDEIMQRAGIEKMNMFGSLSIYYSISKDPREWDEISEIPFGKMYSRLMMDKTMSEIEKEKNSILAERAKHNKN